MSSAHSIFATQAEGTSPDLAATYLINNQPVSSPLNNVTAPLVTIPALGQKWFDTATGTTSALTVPTTASGDIIVDGPSAFTIESTLFHADGSSVPTALACTQVAGEDLTLGRLSVDTASVQPIDVTPVYSCESTGTGLPNFSTAQVFTTEITATLPSAVTPGQTIPATAISLNETLDGQFATTLGLIDRGKIIDDVAFPGAALSLAANGQSIASPLAGLTAAPTTIGTSAVVGFEADGTTSPITVPTDADGAITLSAPQQYELSFTVDTGPGTTTVATDAWVCTADDGEDLTLATIHVIQPPAHATLTASSPKSSAFGNAVTVPVGTSVPPLTPKPAPPGGTQDVDATKIYTCNAWTNQTSVPTDGTTPDFSNQLIASTVTTTLPAAVNPGSTIASTNASITWSVPSEIVNSLSTALGTPSYADVDNVSLPGAALSIGVDGQTSASALTGLSSTTETPPPSGFSSTNGPEWLVEVDGSTSAITVPANASSDVTISAPQQYDVLFTLEPSAAGIAAGDATTPVAMQCTSNDPVTLATIRVVRPLPAITHPVPTGKVLIMRGNKGVAQGTLKNGKANVVIPGTALPVGKNTLTVKYTGDSNTLAATPKTITVVKTKTSPTLAVHVTPGKVAAGAVFPTVNVRLSGPGKAKGGKITVTAGTVHKTATLLFDGTTSVQLPPFATAGHKVIRVSYAGNANFVAKTVTAGLNVTKTKLGKFVVKVKPAKVIAKKTRATLLITLGAPDKLNHGVVTVRLAGRIIAKKVIAGTGKITLPKFASAGRKVLHLTFAGNASVVARTITKAVKVTRAPKHHRK